MQLSMNQLLAGLISLLLLSATPSSAAEAADCGENDVLVTTTPVPPQRSWSVGRLRSHEQKIREPADVVLIGDSMAERWPKAELEALFPGKKVVNIGLGSDVTQITLWRLRSVDYGKLNPEQAVLFLGTNNIGGASACAIRLGIEKVIDEMYKLWPKLKVVFVLKIFPKGRGLNQFSKQISDANNEFYNINIHDRNVKIVSPPADISCRLQDFSSVYTSLVTLFYSTPCIYYEPDLLHLSPDGYRLVTETLGEHVSGP